jgi:glyoxylase-like metal-dependent hydrolase (beta-lactamase superfamily II)
MAQQQDLGRVEIVTVPVADGLYMLVGQGGNIGVSVGEDGIVLVDDQFAPLLPKIKAALAELDDGPVRVVLNTHWHFDHTGGNELLAGAGAIIVAHENVRKRMSSEQFIATFEMTMPPSPAAALPVVTFTRDVTLHLNGVTIEVQHAPPAHTDGDSIVWFRELNAVHMGDTYFAGMYPFIDFNTGGNIRGMIEAVDAMLPRMDANTRIIPGHGPLSNAEELRAYRDMLATVADRIDSLIAEGKSADEVIAAKPASDYDASLAQGFLKSDDWVRMVYQGMTAQ